MCIYIHKHTFYSMNILYVIFVHIYTCNIFIYVYIYRYKIYEYKRNVGLPWWLSGKKICLPINAGDTGSISDLGKSHMLQSN